MAEIPTLTELRAAEREWSEARFQDCKALIMDKMRSLSFPLPSSVYINLPLPYSVCVILRLREWIEARGYKMEPGPQSPGSNGQMTPVEIILPSDTK